MDPEAVRRSLSKPSADSFAVLPAHLIEGIALNGIRLDDIEHGRVLYSCTVTPRLGSPGGVLIGGVIATLVDVIGSIALSTCGLPTTGVSLDINISYLDAAMIGEEIEIEAKVLHVREPITVISVKLRKKATGKLIAEGRHTNGSGGAASLQALRCTINDDPNFSTHPPKTALGVVAALMAVQGRGSAAAAVAQGLALLCLLLHSDFAGAATYTVGDSRGWTFNTASWPNGKRFRAGDVLVFRYSPSVHNVVTVSASGYNSCSVPIGARTLRSGNDRITLGRGTSYFICGVSGHCQSGMKIAVTAA
ncbi:uncharacterized protein LOC121969784 isoform X1 [Zingiber officinale]|uniref:uncharacterized protein LOC121969784 isoform X1 n=1 Tax=Zingiber officinale TaxID=94328 RepID=UPI001C4BCE60|nr:uncharacterized protein LOC121969784 isoform X1 [Zingiber officinale]